MQLALRYAHYTRAVLKGHFDLARLVLQRITLFLHFRQILCLLLTSNACRQCPVGGVVALKWHYHDFKCVLHVDDEIDCYSDLKTLKLGQK